ncbi:MAG: type II secretion system protein [Kiritimatiellae bacterium]|nr:type II secretion system protein [Kiritimatiellia bacterium]
MMKEAHKADRRRSGFSLLELLAVMSIMAMLSTVAVTGYFSAVRGMARRSAVKHLVNTLVLARQRACLEGARISVMLYNENTGDDEQGSAAVVPSYVVCKEIGTISNISGDRLIDEFETLGKFFDLGGQAMSGSMGEMLSMRLYNMTVGGWWEVKPWVEEKYGLVTGRDSAYDLARNLTPKPYDLPVYVFTKNQQVTSQRRPANEPPGGWRVGHSYGIEAVPVNSLPRGILFDDLDERVDRPAICITFRPDGSAEQAETVRLVEKNPPKRGLSISVSRNDGTIKYSEQWK